MAIIHWLTESMRVWDGGLTAKIAKSKKNIDNFRYREYLFLELLELYPDTFKNKRILEIGPRDGLDTFRLETLDPKEIVIMDLKNRTEENKHWLKNLKVKNSYIEANYMYLSPEEYKQLGKFDLIWFRLG